MEDLSPCEAAWPEMARRLERDPEARARPLRRGGAVMRFDDVALKYIPQSFGRILRAHRQAARALRGDPLNHAPRYLGADDARQVIAIAFVRGTPMRDLVADGAAPETLCAQAGRWLAAFHAARPGDVHPFDAQAALRRIPERAAYLPDAFGRARAVLADQAAILQMSPQPRAVLHGDLNASNLLVQDHGAVCGIDFENLHLHPAMRDAGQLLAELHLRAALPPDRLLPETWRAAFEKSYGAGGEMLTFFTLQRLLRQWATVPASPGDRGAAREAMARAIAKLAQSFA